MLSGGFLVLLCFFIPWTVIDTSPIGGSSIMQTIGIRLALTEVNFATLALITAITILVISIYISVKKTSRIFRTIVLICCVVGAFSIIISLNQIGTEYRPYRTVIAGTNLARNPQSELNFDKVFNLHYGGYGIIIGYVLAFIGACNISTYNQTITDI